MRLSIERLVTWFVGMALLPMARASQGLCTTEAVLAAASTGTLTADLVEQCEEIKRLSISRDQAEEDCGNYEVEYDKAIAELKKRQSDCKTDKGATGVCKIQVDANIKPDYFMFAVLVKLSETGCGFGLAGYSCSNTEYKLKDKWIATEGVVGGYVHVVTPRWPDAQYGDSVTLNYQWSMFGYGSVGVKTKVDFDNKTLSRP